MGGFLEEIRERRIVALSAGRGTGVGVVTLALSFLILKRR
jgi:hypothetical protein